jgi:hypothetical protein
VVELMRNAAPAVMVLSLLAALWWLKRRRPGGIRIAARASGRRLECLERIALGPQHALHLVRCGRTALLLASSPGGCRLIQARPLEEEGAEERR